MGLTADKFADCLRLARFDRPAGTLLLLWPTLWGLWVAAGGFPGWKWLAVFVAGVVVMRAFGGVVNDIADRDLDAAVRRTKNRPLAAGRLSVPEAVAVAIVLALAALVLWLALPPLAKIWAVAALVGALLYPLAKRFLPLPQAALGIVFGMGLPIADIAVNNAAPAGRIWLFFAANWLWIVAYDTLYAIADREDDRAKGGVHSAALLFGAADVKIVAALYAATILWLSAVGVFLGYGVAYQVALVAAMVCAFRFWRDYKTRDPQACLAVFRANHWFGLFVFAGIVAATDGRAAAG